MITSPQEYKDMLTQLKNPNDYLHYVQVPKDETVYKIDLNSRTIDAPKFLSVSEDHNAEVLWFSVDRFFDSYDLAHCTCWVQYKNANGDMFYYSAPLIIKGEEYGNDTILIPWVVSKEVTAKAGNIEFAFQFFTLSADNLRFVFMLNTLPAKSQVLNSINIENPESDAKQEFAADELRMIYSELNRLSGAYHLFWVDNL